MARIREIKRWIEEEEERKDDDKNKEHKDLTAARLCLYFYRLYLSFYFYLFLLSPSCSWRALFLLKKINIRNLTAREQEGEYKKK